MQIRYHHRRSAGRHAPPRRDTLPLRLGVSLLLCALALAAQHWEPALLDPLREQLLANTGEFAEAFARFSDALGSGEPVAEAWAALRGDLAAELTQAQPVSDITP